MVRFFLNKLKKTEIITAYKYYFAMFSFLVVSLILVYYLLLIKNINIENNKIIDNTIVSYVGFMSSDSSNFNFYFKELYDLSKKSNFSLILTDANGKIVPLPFLNSSNAYFQESFEKYTYANQANVILNFKGKDHYLHYVVTDKYKSLFFFPFFQLVIIIIIIILAFYGYSLINQNKQEKLWIAMAKETAHQLGTPITSLIGWKDYLKELADNDGELSLVYDGVEKDIDRINLVINRFSHISAKTDKEFINLAELIPSLADYMKNQIPQKRKTIDIEVEIENEIKIFADQLLIEWALENLIKNSIQALLKNERKGKISIKISENKEAVYIDISDNGIGISSANRKKIFETGFSTKKRGWGIGLSLTRRVIEDFHDGEVFVKESTPHKGTTIRIILNKYV